MTIRKRLILSHLAVFFVPLLMTFIVVLVAAVGLVVFARNGNHIYIESTSEFQYTYSIVRRVILHRFMENGNPAAGQYLVGLLAPDQNLIVLRKNNQTVYDYGNHELTARVRQIQDKAERDGMFSGSNGTCTYTSDNDLVYLEKYTVGNNLYTLSFMSQRERQNSDKVLDDTIRFTVYSVFISLLLFVAVASWFFSHFVLRRILQPLDGLRDGAEKIRQGNLEIKVSNHYEDEFSPVIETFNLMAEKLSASLKEREFQEECRRELIASISHDLRTPITAVKAYVDGLLEKVADTPEKQERYLRIIRKKTDELNRMIEQLFLFSKIEYGERNETLVLIDLGSFLEKYIEENHFNWERFGAEIVLTAKYLPCINGSRLLLERILDNVIGNSLKYKTNERVKCEILLTEEAGNAVVTICDDGPGVPEELLPHLFEPFYRTDKARSHTEEGCGLGLAIAGKAAEIMGGWISARNRYPRGLAIELKLPEIVRNENSDYRNRK